MNSRQRDCSVDYGACQPLWYRGSNIENILIEVRELFNACKMDEQPQKDTTATTAATTAAATTEPAAPEEEREIEKSPSQRFIKYDKEVGRGSFKTVYKALDTVHAQPVAWLELQPHKLTKEDRHRFKVLK